MSSSSIHCALCREQIQPNILNSAKPSCKNVKIYVKSTDRASSPIRLFAPCSGTFEDLPRYSNESRQVGPAYCPYHSRLVSTNMNTKFCCTPATDCHECKCAEVCETHGPSCPHNHESPVRLRARNSARVDPDPLE